MAFCRVEQLFACCRPGAPGLAIQAELLDAALYVIRAKGYVTMTVGWHLPRSGGDQK